MLFQPKCSFETGSGTCGCPASRVEVIRPWELPANWNAWVKQLSLWFNGGNAPSYHFIYDGPGGSNGSGDTIDQKRAESIIAMFSGKPDCEAILAEFYDGAGLCGECQDFYCSQHWSISGSGYGTCPRSHGKSLDPHWSPDSDFLDHLNDLCD